MAFEKSVEEIRQDCYIFVLKSLIDENGDEPSRKLVSKTVDKVMNILESVYKKHSIYSENNEYIQD